VIVFLEESGGRQVGVVDNRLQGMQRGGRDVGRVQLV
jgi:hypothetical protein